MDLEGKGGGEALGGMEGKDNQNKSCEGKSIFNKMAKKIKCDEENIEQTQHM